MPGPTVAILAALDTKAPEATFLRQRLADLGATPFTIDIGTSGIAEGEHEVNRADVAQAAGREIAALARGDRAAGVAAMGAGAARILADRPSTDSVAAVIGIGGSTGTAICATAMRGLPLGFPKLLVTTMAGSNLAPLITGLDVVLLATVVDLSGVNRISSLVLARAAQAAAAMASAPYATASRTRTVAATMFGVTTPGVTHAKSVLEHAGYEVLVFHANGVGGDAMEQLAAAGEIDGILDLTTTEFADAVADGAMPAGPHRVVGDGRAVPRVVSLGALDVINFGPLASVPERYRKRALIERDAAMTLMRTGPDEARAAAALLAERLTSAPAVVELFIPQGGMSAASVPGADWHDPETDELLIAELLSRIGTVPHHEHRGHVNDPAFADTMAKRLLAMMAAPSS